ncbi:unnamed protein product [Hermetia illucens]|uniref:Uncharacterized protein n=1 Tax=Hermetia illucens TaxID=343691 RepID=A0A7R8UA83_HERIL|nr:unnamed protein product [Hermetia illucens]
MDPMELFNNEIARCRQMQMEMQALLDTMNDQYINTVLPYITEFPDKRVLAQKFYDQACFLSNLMRANLEHIHRVEEQIVLLQMAGNPRGYYEDDVGYSSDNDDTSSDMSLGDETLSSDDGHESSGYETQDDLEID